ncbi:hypothetical protein [Deinococcus sp. UYEF24]
MELRIRLSEHSHLIGRSVEGDWMQFYAIIADQEWHLGAECASHVIKNKGEALENIRQSIPLGLGFINFSETHTSMNFRFDVNDVRVIAHDKNGELIFNEILR